MTSETLTQLVTVSEAARMLGLKNWPVYQLCMAGELPAVGRYGTTYLISEADVFAYAERADKAIA